MRLIYYFDTYISPQLAWHCFSISEDLHRFARNLQHMNAKLFSLLFLNNFKRVTPWSKNKNNFGFIYCKFLANLCKFQKYWNNAMSNDGLIIENMDLSHIHLAVLLSLFFLNSGWELEKNWQRVGGGEKVRRKSNRILKVPWQ